MISFSYLSGLWSGSCVGSLWRDRNLSDFIKNILICVQRMNEGLTDVERHEDE